MKSRRDDGDDNTGGWNMSAPAEPVYQRGGTELPANFRTMVSLRPAFRYVEARELACMLGCSEAEAGEARRWIVEDSLEVAA